MLNAVVLVSIWQLRAKLQLVTHRKSGVKMLKDFRIMIGFFIITKDSKKVI
jgi:hypothetical protein